MRMAAGAEQRDRLAGLTLHQAVRFGFTRRTNSDTMGIYRLRTMT